jgi:hypothetical protein
MYNYVSFFLREDGTFTINNIPSGSYVVEVANPNYAYEPVRVEINSKGKYRARKVNYIQTSQVLQLPYPLKMKPLNHFRYFQVREQWRVTDFLFSPMVSFRCDLCIPTYVRKLKHSGSLPKECLNILNQSMFF